MNSKVRNIFVFTFIFSVFFLSLQSTVLQFCKDTVKKAALNISIAEEEDETEKTELEEDVVYLDHSILYCGYMAADGIHWSDFDAKLLNSENGNHTPPPKHLI